MTDIEIPDEAVETAVATLMTHQWYTPADFPNIWRLSEHRNHEADLNCALCRGDAGEIARVALAAGASLIVRAALAAAAGRLRRASSGRAEYASRFPEGAQRDVLESEALILRLAADVVLGDDGPLYGWLPSWRWTDEMTARLRVDRRGVMHG